MIKCTHCMYACTKIHWLNKLLENNPSFNILHRSKINRLTWKLTASLESAKHLSNLQFEFVYQPSSSMFVFKVKNQRPTKVLSVDLTKISLNPLMPTLQTIPKSMDDLRRRPLEVQFLLMQSRLTAWIYVWKSPKPLGRFIPVNPVKFHCN